ncbi:unnamed protein product [Prorocentrum cordatum]|uniref:Reverse transcriptase domain-containing protein n=1 Tax=Prorocentrum cordatum TaxID=2364126 RepID=A0ABN9TQD2_9DINO|nr:unnamed protein product [Polarella glacialis]
MHTALGQVTVQPRALGAASGLATCRVADVRMKCEEPCCWPGLVRLAKPGGGHGLLASINAAGRVWSRIRRPLSKRRELDHPCDAFWGSRPVATHAAFQRNLDSELARLQGHSSISVLIDLYKYFETIELARLLEHARVEGFPLRLIWLVLSSYQAPKVIKAYGSAIEQYRSCQHIWVGCSHACAIVHLLLWRVFLRMRTNCEEVMLRDLMDDASSQRAGPDPAQVS